MKYLLYGSLWVVLSFWSTVQAQTNSGLRLQKLLASSDSIRIDSLPLLPGSVRLQTLTGLLQEKTDYTVDYANSLLVFNKAIDDTIMVSYRVLALDILRPRFNKDITLNSSLEQARQNPYRPEKIPETAEDWLGLGSLEKNGSISRALSVGNNQNVVLNSGFNLQLRGKITNDVELLASVTDDNLPFQPDGFTQQLQDFDRVFVQIRNQDNSLIVGDYDLNRPQAYFLNSFKNVKGVKSDNLLYRKRGDTITQSVNFSAARGQFGRNVFLGREGNQGPYRLQGEENSGFVVVLAGSERVYIDGVLLKRGEQYDYIIDYNTADLTFTPNRLITNQSRIIVEFEYANQAYVRSILFYNLNLQRKNHRFTLNSYQEQDASNQPLFQELDDDQKRFLAGLGDSVGSAFYPGVSSAGYSVERINYKQIDSLGFAPVYVYSTNSDSAIYEVRFSFVGQGKGDYRQAQGTANGRVYEWIAPTVSGSDTLHLGSYAPVTRLIAPNKRSMTTLGAQGRLSAYTRYETELALSRQDLNRFSDANSANQQGKAGKLKIDHKQPLGWEHFPKATVEAGMQYEYLDARFRTIQPYRNMEFARDWNLNRIFSEQEEHLRGVYAGVRFNDSSALRYSINELRTGAQQGLRQRVEGKYLQSGHKVEASADLLRSRATNFSGDYLRSVLAYQRFWTKYEAGIRFEQENNRQRVLAGDSLSANSFRFDIIEVYGGSSNKRINQWQLKYNYRHDFLPFSQNLLATQTGHNYTVSTAINQFDDHQFELTATYRDLQLFSTPNQSAGRENNYLGQLEYSGRFWKELIIAQTFYAFSQGQELRREIAFLEVPAGQGNYSWNDYNSNGIQELDEFEQSIFSDQANFIKIFIPGNSFVPTFGNRFNQTLNINPARLFTNKKTFWARWSNLSAIALERKNQGNNGLRFLNPFDLNLFDSSLVSTQGSIRNTLFFNRNNPNFGIDFGYQRSIQKNLLSGGFETRQQYDRQMKLRLNLLKDLNAEAQLTQGERVQEADLFFRRNYRIAQWELQPRLNWTATARLRVSLMYSYRDKQNLLGLELPGLLVEKASINDLSAELNYNLAGSSSVQLSFSQVSNNFRGDANTPAAFEILQGLQPGSNQLWGVSVFRKLASQLQLNLSYNGRKSEASKTIHTGQMQARLVF